MVVVGGGLFVILFEVAWRGMVWCGGVMVCVCVCVCMRRVSRCGDAKICVCVYECVYMYVCMGGIEVWRVSSFGAVKMCPLGGLLGYV